MFVFHSGSHGITFFVNLISFKITVMEKRKKKKGGNIVKRKG